jgi:hypothetical protein
MPDQNSGLLDEATRIDLATRLDAALDDQTGDDAMAAFLSLAAEIRAALQRPSLNAAERARIHARALEPSHARANAGLRRAWPQLAQLGSHPAVLGGAAAAVLALVGVAALRDRRGHGGPAILPAA